MDLGKVMDPKDLSRRTLSERRSMLLLLRTLLWKNWVLKKRHLFATICEMVVPMLFILALSCLKTLTTDVTVPEGWSDSTTSTDDSVGTSYNLYQSTGSFNEWVSTQLPKFTQYESSLTGLILSLVVESINDAIRLDELSDSNYTFCATGVLVGGLVDANTSSSYRVPTECDDKVSPYKIAIIPDTTFTREYFLQTMDIWYPRIDLLNSSDSVQIPSFRESVTFFDSNDDLDTYIQGDTYGDGLSNPRIYGAIVFDSYPAADDVGTFASMEYSIRLNSTAGMSIGHVPATDGDPSAVYPYQKALTTDYYTSYTITGFATLQTLVTRFVSCMPEWDSSSQSTTGVCQRELSTAQSSTEVDTRLLNSLNNDALLQSYMSSAAMSSSAGNSSISSFSSLSAQLSDETKEMLLTPLRQAPQPYLGATVAPFPIESYVSSPFYSSVSQVFGIVFVLSYLFIVSRILVIFIQEKESRMREFMKILGVKEKAIIASWYIMYLVILFIGAVLQALAGMVGVFTNSSPIVIFLFFYLFSISVLSFAFLISTLFSKARVGSFVGMVLFFVMYFVSQAFSTSTGESSKNAGCLLSPVALTLGVTALSDAEATGEGIGFSNMSTLSSNFRFQTALLMFIIDSAVYTLLGLYFEKVIPKEYGTTLKWYFPVSPSYWRNRRHGGVNTTQGPLLDDVVLDVNPNFEPVNADLREQERRGEMLSVQRLRKVFQVPGGEKVAVNGVNLAMYKNQITCLLGHNGAGKSTLISMLTGMTAPSSGNATYQGMSINEDMEEMRESLGICFQHDVLFSDMTVEEHLIFFGRIKGYTDVELRAVVDTQIREVGLTEKRHVKSGELSGGMKRKLSVAVCLLGDSSLVFLDEPTSGMDPYSRRSTWEILLNNRNDRVMVLTTHFMDEADILGDRIAIMSEGEVRCCGSSLFLKNRFGAGYNLTLVKDDERCKENDVVSFVTSFVPSAQLLSNVGSEIAFQLPIDSSSHFAAMFAKMDDQMSRLGLLSYGVSVTTLEEVFIKVAEANDDGNQHTLSKEARHVTPASSPASSTATSDSVIRQQAAFGVHLKALLLKRFRYAKRDKKMLIYSAALPIVLLAAGLGMMKSSSNASDDPTLALTTSAYSGDSTPTPYFCQADANDWCSTVMNSPVFTGASPTELSISEPAYSSSSPTVFNVSYSDPTINGSDATGYGLAVSYEAYKRGYGVNTATVEGQFGALLVYGDSDTNLLSYNIFTNTSGTHSSAIFKALMDQGIYRFFASNASSSGTSSVDLKVSNYPLPLTAANKAYFTSTLAFAASLLICIAFTFFPASVVVFLVKEKQANHNSKHQQLVSGVSLSAFWFANYIWDMALYVIPCVAGVILIKAFDISAMTGSSECTSCTSETFPAVILLFVLFGFAVCPFTYCLSYLFKEHASAQTFTIMINLIIGVVLMVVSFILDLINSTTEDVNKVLIYLWRLSPLFNLGNGLLSLVQNEMTSTSSGSDETTSPFSTDIMGFELLYLFFTSILYFGLAIGIDYALTFPKIKDAMTHHDGGDDEHVELDSDVVKEAERVARGDADNDVVKLANLRKVYPGGKVAVRDLSFGLKRGECFGFLGINGAGKTTTMKMLTGDELPTHGGATLSGFDILTQQIEVRRQIGYCPQFDALFDLLTVREHLELFASIKGASGAELASVVDEKIEQLNLADFENKLAGSLSGGNKRKLSVAIAMIGNPRIIFLDEPSTGMDPVSRRFMWDVIAGISTRGKSSTIVLTTHSMEEAEALCSRVGIMVGGRMRCLGSVQHLKGRFGDGLVFDVKLNMPTPDELEYLVQEVFGTTDGVVTPADLEAKCHAFGNHHLAERVVASHPTGYGMAAAMERDGFIRAEAFCSWCVEETRFDALHAFLTNAFGNGGALVMERQNDFCRFKLRGSSEQLKLSTVFALIEEAKASLDIREYSVSQTTLEQIFNGFASQQQEEQGVAHGVFTD